MIIEKTLRSLLPLKGRILINDLGSTDNTVEICQNYGATISTIPLKEDFSILRNNLIEESETDLQMFLRPGETIMHGHKSIEKTKCPCAYSTVLLNGIISKEIRIWNKSFKYKFKNPIFEHLDAETDEEINTVICSHNDVNYDEYMRLIRVWEEENPLSPEPVYYEAYIELMRQNYERFLRLSEYYMFLDKRISQSTTMNRYYFALIQVYHCHKVRPALQNLNLCLCHNPLMAEFWCLIGDVYYHLLNNFNKAKSFYENAIILGSRRKKKSKWPMEISKYDDYPKKMIKSCDGFIRYHGLYVG